MRIVISGPATVIADGSDHLTGHPDAPRVTDPAVLRTLDGYDGEPEDPLADDVDADLTDRGPRVSGGTLRFAFDPAGGGLRVVTEYRARRALTADELAALVRETEGAWSDGEGENGYEAAWPGGSGRVYPYRPGGGRDTRAEQLPD